MKYILESIHPNGIRLGKVIITRDSKDIALTTPTCLSYTRMGLFPYLTPDMMDKIPFKPTGATLSASTLYVYSL